MALHDDLLVLARQMVDRTPGVPNEAEWRRTISTAYYALFHLLVYEATLRLVAVPALRPRVSRTFDHKLMRLVCQEYDRLSQNAAGQKVSAARQIVPMPIVTIASDFVILQDARHEADYDVFTTIAHADADKDVTRAEVAFLDWTAVQADPAADMFLAELWCRGIPKR